MWLRFLELLPRLFELMKSLEGARKYPLDSSKQKKKKLKEDLSELEKAIREKDSAKINNLFNDMDQ